MSAVAELEREAAYSDHMAEMAKYWMARAQKAERETLEIVARLALANGGELRLTSGAMRPHAADLVLERYTDYRTLDVVYRAVNKEAS